jgi:hypothetical protein
MSSLDSIWVALGAFAGFIFFILIFAKYILPRLYKWYKTRVKHQVSRKGSDEGQAAVEHQDHSDSADSNLIPTDTNPIPTDTNPAGRCVHTTNAGRHVPSSLDKNYDEEEYEEHNQRLRETPV